MNFQKMKKAANAAFLSCETGISDVLPSDCAQHLHFYG